MRKFLVIQLCFFVSLLVQAQSDNLMIIEYVDWDPGSGLGVKIYNPTNNNINLSNYYLTRYRDGDTNPNDQEQMFGVLAPGQSKIFGNSAFCGDCSSGCNQIDIIGTNSEDVIAITLGASNNIVDMVGAYGSANKITVGGVSDAIYHNKLVRDNDNCIRYTDLAGTSTNSWPSSSSVNVTNWNALGVSCLSQSQVNLTTPIFDLGEDTTICADTMITLSVNVPGATYLWNGTTSGNSFTVSAGMYTLKVTKDFCSAEDEIVIDTVNCDTASPPPPVIPPAEEYIPNVITPNNDQKNDEFKVRGFVSPFRVVIYNRWGRPVFESNDYQNDWNAEDVPDGVYFYELETNTFEKRNGWLQIIR